jgi:transcriptional regulator with XRE-family HTH domain
MQDMHLTQKVLQSEHGIPNATMSGFLHGKTMPTYETLIKLLNVFNCSADFLLGLEEYPTEETLYPVQPFSQRFKQILADKHISQERVKRELPVSASVLYKWVSGKNLPSATSLIRLAEFLDCSVDYLIGRRR